MNIKPPLAPPAKTAGTFGRLFSGVFLGGFNLFLLLVALALYVLPMQEQVTPVELYHRTWQTAADNAYDTAKLKDWAAWEHKYDSQIKTDEDAIKFANEMLESTGDHYASLLPPEAVKAEGERSSGEFAGIGVGVEAKTDADGKPVMAADPKDGPLMLTDDSGYPLIKDVKIGGPAMQAGMRNGDAIVSINGVSAKDATIKAMVAQMRGKVGEEVTVVVTRGGKNVTLKIVRGTVKTEVVSSKMLTAANGKQVGYIRLEHFMEEDAAAEMADAISKLGATDKLIIDLRFNPGGNVMVCLQLANLFIQDGKLVSIRERDTGGSHSLSTFSVTPKDMVISVKNEASGRVKERHVERLAAVAANKEIVILVNGHSASASEMFTGALKDNGRATVVGERTFGKGIGQSVIPMPNGTSLHITSLRYFTPSGKWLGDGGNSSESYGIEPDHQVKLVETPKTRLGSPNDNQLSFALELIAK